MNTRIRFSLFLCGATFCSALFACGSPQGGTGESGGGEPATFPGSVTMRALDMAAVHDAEERAAAARPETPAIQRPFLKGHFETRNKEFPVEVEQAMAGARTDRPVIVWAASEPKTHRPTR